MNAQPISGTGPDAAAVAMAAGVASFFRAAADRVRAAEPLGVKIAAKRRELSAIDPAVDGPKWDRVLLELFDLEVERRAGRR